MMKRSLCAALCLAVGLASAAVPARAAGLGDVIRTLETPFQAKTDRKQRIFDYSADFFQESKIASLDRMQRASGRVEVAFDYAAGERMQTVPVVRFRWQYEQPTTQEIVSDGKSLWVYLPENNQVILSDVEQVNRARENDPMTFLTGLGNLSRDFRIGFAVPEMDGDGNYILELTPVRVSSLINRMVIVVDRDAVEAYQARARGGASSGNDSGSLFPPPMPSPMAQPAPIGPPGFGGPALPGTQGGPDGLWFPIRATTVFDPNGNSTVIEFSNLRVNLGIPGMTFNFIMPAGVQVVRPTGKEMGY